MKKSLKVYCTNCNWKGKQKNLLKHPNPFLDGDIVSYCPECKTPENFKFEHGVKVTVISEKRKYKD